MRLVKSSLPILVATLIIVAIMLMVFSMFIGEAKVATILSMLFFMTLVGMLVSLGLVALKAQKKPSIGGAPNVISVIACQKCNYRGEKAYTSGDFVFKRLGSCVKCGGETFIWAIYSVKHRE